MKSTFAVAMSTIVAVSLAGAIVAVAEQANRTVETANPQVGNAASESSLGKLDDKTTGSTVRASQLIGANLKNSNGDSVGEIKDLVIDGSGKVRYAAVTYGGFLGVGSKLFAVPFAAFKVRQNPNDPNDRGDYVLTLDVTKEQLDGAVGFDNNKWPDFADKKFTQDLDRRYNIGRSSSDSAARATR